MAKLLRWFLVSVVLVVLTACGGGGSGSQHKNDNKTRNTLSDRTEVIEPTKLISKVKSDDQDTIVVSDGAAKSIHAGSVVHIPAGTDDRFPLGFAAKVKSKEKLANGDIKIVLDDVAFSELIDKIKTPKVEIPLTEENFIGVIAPSAVHGTGSPYASAKKFGSNGKSFLNGGIVFHKRAFLAKALGDVGRVTPSNIELKLNIDLADSELEASKLKPYGGRKELKATLRGTLSNLVITESHDIDIINLKLKPYVKMNVEVRGDLSAELKLDGGASATLGSFNRAWKEVRKKSFEKFGIVGSLTGLEDEDKIGKYPIVGLVFVNPTPIVTYGKTQTPIRTAKSGGFVVWVYMNAKGELSIDGAIGIATNTRFTLGLDKPKGGEFSMKKTLTNIPGNRMLEAPFIEGEVEFKATVGLSLEVDSFIAGIRLANAGVDMLGSYTQIFTVKSNEAIRASYGIDTLGKPWSWNKTRICTEGRGEAGVLAHFDSELNIKAKRDGATKWTSFDITKNFLDIHKQFPTQDSIDAAKESDGEGWVKYMWYIFDRHKQCYGNHIPVAESISISVEKDSQDNTIALKGTDEDGDIITYKISAEPTHGGLNGTPPSLKYTPESGYSGKDSFAYTMDDGFEKTKSVTVSIMVGDNLPVITIQGDNPATIKIGESYEDGGATAWDYEEDKSVEVAIIYDDVNTSKVGEYKVIYQATNSAGNVAKATRKVKVEDDGNNCVEHHGMTYCPVTSPTTGKVWLDRNLGAAEVCTAYDDTACYGDYYQWGRNTDGHEKSDSESTNVQADNVNNVGHGKLITTDEEHDFDWAKDADLNGTKRVANWRKTDGASVCPSGYRVATLKEFKSELFDEGSARIDLNATEKSGNSDDSRQNAYNTFLKIPSAGVRNADSNQNDTLLYGLGELGIMWTVTTSGSTASYFAFAEDGAMYGSDEPRALGNPVRCIKYSDDGANP